MTTKRGSKSKSKKAERPKVEKVTLNDLTARAESDVQGGYSGVRPPPPGSFGC